MEWKKYHISASLYVGVFEVDSKGEQYIDGDNDGWGDFYFYDTDDFEEAEKHFDAITTNIEPSVVEGDTLYVSEGLGMKDKTIAMYLHNKYPWADAIYADFHIEDVLPDSESYFNMVSEVLYYNDSDVSNYNESYFVS